MSKIKEISIIDSPIVEEIAVFNSFLKLCREFLSCSLHKRYRPLFQTLFSRQNTCYQSRTDTLKHTLVFVQFELTKTFTQMEKVSAIKKVFNCSKSTTYYLNIKTEFDVSNGPLLKMSSSVVSFR